MQVSKPDTDLKRQATQSLWGNYRTMTGAVVEFIPRLVERRPASYERERNITLRLSIFGMQMQPRKITLEVGRDIRADNLT